MPFYEYECPHCGYHDEVLQKINDKPLKKCPSCGKNGLRKLMSAPVFRLKGSGWYETDFKSDKENKRNLAGADKEEAKTDAKTDSKADAKVDAQDRHRSRRLPSPSRQDRDRQDREGQASADKPAPARSARRARRPRHKACAQTRARDESRHELRAAAGHRQRSAAQPGGART